MEYSQINSGIFEPTMDYLGEVKSETIADTALMNHRRSMNTGQRIEVARVKAGLSQDELGAMLNHNQSWISKLERNDIRLRVQTLLEIAAALNVSAGSLLPDLPAGTSSDTYDVLNEAERTAVDYVRAMDLDKTEVIRRLGQSAGLRKGQSNP